MTAEAQLNFAKQALQEALDRMEPEPVAANEAARKVVKLESEDDESGDRP
jgi:serine protease inhibitor ecotin